MFNPALAPRPAGQDPWPNSDDLIEDGEDGPATTLAVQVIPNNPKSLANAIGRQRVPPPQFDMRRRNHHVGADYFRF